MTKKEVKCGCAESHQEFCNPDVGTLSDGYHTFNELYEHRIALFIALCRLSDLCWVHSICNKDGIGLHRPWRAKHHHDGTLFEGGWFIMGIGSSKGEQITYRLPMSKWNETEFCEDFENAPDEFDGHTPDDVTQRLYKL